MASSTRRFLRIQRRLSLLFDRLLPGEYRVLGTGNFGDFRNLARPYLTPGATVYDIGGGKIPFINADLKQSLGLTVIGFDIDADQLASAPADAYDGVICADITQYRGKGDADVVICTSVLEHVRDTRAAFDGIASVLKPGGHALVDVPSRNAFYARLNRVLPEQIKRRILYILSPETHMNGGFPAYYNRCTPRDFQQLARETNLVVEQQKTYFYNDYYTLIFPFYVIWRLWILFYRLLAKEQSAETFAVALRKRVDA
jgi:2-polyprenyl-3-methyl-5-hydroxy-6-metoxy-1,4-benzoquinol methylase